MIATHCLHLLLKSTFGKLVLAFTLSFAREKSQPLTSCRHVLQPSEMLCFLSSALSFSGSCRSRHNCMIAAINGQMLHVCAALLPEIETRRKQVLKESMQDAMMVRTSMASIGTSKAYRAVCSTCHCCRQGCPQAVIYSMRGCSLLSRYYTVYSAGLRCALLAEVCAVGCSVLACCSHTEPAT